jgi:hypothetical protein
MTNIWRRCPSGRLLAADLLKKQNGGMSQDVALEFFEYAEPEGGLPVTIIMITMNQFAGGVKI